MRTATTTSSTPMSCIRRLAASSRPRAFTLEGHARRARQPGRHAGRARDAEQRQSAGPGRPDQQGLEPDLCGFRAVESRPAARLSFRSRRCGRRGAGGAHLGPPGFNGYTLNVVGANRQPVLISQIYVRQRDLRHRRLDNDCAQQSENRQGGAVLRLALARPGQAECPASCCNRRTSRPTFRAPPFRRVRQPASSAATGWVR